MEEKVAMELMIDMMKKAGLEEYEALALISQYGKAVIRKGSPYHGLTL